MVIYEDLRSHFLELSLHSRGAICRRNVCMCESGLTMPYVNPFFFNICWYMHNGIYTYTYICIIHTCVYILYNHSLNGLDLDVFFLRIMIIILEFLINFNFLIFLVSSKNGIFKIDKFVRRAMRVRPTVAAEIQRLKDT